MRTYLRCLAVIQTGAASILFIPAAAYAAWAGFHLPHPTDLFRTPSALLPPILFSLLAAVGGILWCLTALTLPPVPPGPVPARRPVRRWLRVLALVQLGIGLLLATGTAAYASDRLLLRPRQNIGESFTAVVVLHAAVGLSCVGGILWCVVRVAYPDGKTGKT
ncbi:MAG TPA: hypothetical protein VH092_36890 [Urbifossiella sp.]|nr:hypothetical protein [Urbifossiella sp.]